MYNRSWTAVLWGLVMKIYIHSVFTSHLTSCRALNYCTRDRHYCYIRNWHRMLSTANVRGAWQFGRGPRVWLCCISYISVSLTSIIIYRLYKLTLSDHARVSLQSQSRAFFCCTSIQILCKTFHQSTLVGGHKNIFLLGPKPTLDDPECEPLSIKELLTSLNMDDAFKRFLQKRKIKNMVFLCQCNMVLSP